MLWKKKELTTFKNSLSLVNAKVEKTSINVPKSCYGLTISNEQSVTLVADKESVIDSWIADITAASSKPPTTIDFKKEQSNMMKAQKKVGSSVATSAAGKKIIRDTLGEDGYAGIRIIKKLTNGLDGKKKSKEIEEEIIRLGVKVLLLISNKELPLDELKKHKHTVLPLFDTLMHYYTFSYEYSAENIQTHTAKLVEESTKTLAPFFSEKNVEAYKELQKYLTSTRFLDYFYTTEDNGVKDMRKQWYDIIKRAKYIVEAN